jgi:hypothetical protein
VAALQQGIGGKCPPPIILKFFYDLIFVIDTMSELVIISRDFWQIRSKSREFAQIRVNSGFFSGFPDLPEFIFLEIYPTFGMIIKILAM